MKREDLLKLAEKHQAKADAAQRNFWNSGVARYDNTRRQEEDLADALRMAADAADEHNAHLHLKAECHNFVGRAKDILDRKDWTEDEKKKRTDSLISDLVSFGRLMGLIGRD